MGTLENIFVHPKSKLKSLITAARQHQQLNHAFIAALDPEVTRHCHFAHFATGTLTLTVDNSAWANKIHYLIPDLLKQLRITPEFKTVTKIQFVLQKNVPNAAPKRQPPTISQTNEQLWRTTIKQLKEQLSSS